MGIEEFVGKVSLSSIALQAESSRLQGFNLAQTNDDSDCTVDQPQWKLAAGIGNHRFGYILGMRIKTRDAYYEIHYGIEYALEGMETKDITSELIDEFCSKVAFFAVFPYFRASLAQAAARLATQSPLLPLVKMGEVELANIKIVPFSESQ